MPLANEYDALHELSLGSVMVQRARKVQSALAGKVQREVRGAWRARLRRGGQAAQSVCGGACAEAHGSGFDGNLEVLENLADHLRPSPR